MLFLVDGYNITKGDPATSGLTLEEQRETLIARACSRGAVLLGTGHIIIVFDGAGGSGSSRETRGGIEVRYARTSSADDVLASIAASAGEKVCLVSSDRELCGRVQTHARHGWETRPRDVLFDSAKPRAKRGPQQYPSRTAGLPAGANRITEELKKIWLEDEGE